MISGLIVYPLQSDLPLLDDIPLKLPNYHSVRHHEPSQVAVVDSIQ